MNDSISMVLAGNYVVQVVDANGCSQSTVLTVSQPTALSAITSKQDILCHGDTSGSLTVSPIGGQAPYSILWSTGDTLFALNNLAAGSYSAVITDSLGCSYPISINLSEPSVPLALIGFSVDATCHGAQDGSIQVLASGGVGGYSFTLNGGTSSSSGIFTGLNSGSYSVFVTDANGCTASQFFVIDDPDSLIYTSIVNDVSCFGSSDGQVKLNITGGTNTYSILWNTGSQGTEVSGLNGGWYVFTVTDGNGCGFVDSVFINEPSDLQLSITATNPECVNSFDGKLLISSSGGTGNYIYSVNGSSSSGSEEDLGPGEFIVTVTDDNGCKASQTVVLTESRNPCVEIPNWFSPDGNGQNETWVIPGFEFGSYQLFVVNVWGQKVYETRSENYIPWDGTFKGEPLPNGDYYYVVSSSDSSEPTFTGYVTILR
jgi:gliding motility-associated-like protein